MTEEQKEINWAGEAKRIREAPVIEGEFWKPNAGKYKVKFLSSGEETESRFEEGRRRVLFNIEVNNKPFLWEINKGFKQTSVYYQLAAVAENKGNLKGETMEIVVSGADKDKRYNIIEFMDLLPTETPVETVEE